MLYSVQFQTSIYLWFSNSYAKILISVISYLFLFAKALDLIDFSLNSNKSCLFLFVRHLIRFILASAHINVKRHSLVWIFVNYNFLVH
jgi:hypothetical protein